jgi:hypothetical protein
MASKPGERRTPGTKACACGRAPSARGRPACCPGGARCRGGVSLPQALAWNRRTCRPDSDGRSRWVLFACWPREGERQGRYQPEAESTGAGHRDGPARSSDEGLVMGLE